MQWEKKGLIFCPDKENEWIDNTALTPQPFLFNDEVIRVYVSFRDSSGIGRIGYVDVEARNPKNIIQISKKPVLDIGRNGMFDDNGVILGDVLRVGNKLYMYYVAFTIPQKVKFHAFSGLAISEDNGESFKRVQESPILDRSDEGLYGRCLHSVLYENGVFKIWYSVICDWTIINEIPYPSYYIKYTESKDGISFPREGITCIKCNANEYRIGRPKVYKTELGYIMYFTSDTFSKDYLSGYAISKDGISWQRRDDFPLKLSQNGFDSQMLCYPALITTKYGAYLFYAGNGMGRDGFGYAELRESND
ncbi:hypothetical protein JYE83_001224 [Campylobacter upsaliensis]|uniref:hypothetical protein n=1 Tax=Campylobacter upsaliensis TaxID=28080 RepID=UPI000E1ABE06|nr:hypothetical protein [Campylobacter upsaliensis]EAI3670907.1 hypothetical protein [Campylobacter upsaliensis]EAJ7110567.1 hypothetical protein [Campylobacter upsaliensis]EAK1468370.1 hypothetical protein [Campylobacter upsaliensis]EHB2692503.1 hypothetical protein [Campylobacter upsaliensis]EKK0586924.1 hypothetical protein [Campylobacter upsaliensis]